MSEISYTWGIAKLECAPSDNGLQNVVRTVHWTYQATDGTHTASSYGSVGLEAPDAESFTAYALLTEADVIAWLEAKLDVEALQAGLDGQIANLITPPIVSPALPWQ